MTYDVNESKGERIARVARHLAQQHTPWQEFHQQLLGPGSMLDTMHFEERINFQRTAEYRVTMDYFRRLFTEQTQSEPTAVITVRMPESLHAELKVRAAKAGLSMNVFAITQLVCGQAQGSDAA